MVKIDFVWLVVSKDRGILVQAGLGVIVLLTQLPGSGVRSRNAKTIGDVTCSLNHEAGSLCLTKLHKQ